jgi:hypothetical protein
MLNSMHNLQAFYSGSDLMQNIRTLPQETRLSMALYLSANIHQGDELFSVHSRSKQCAFMSLLALLIAQNIPLSASSLIYNI